MNRITLIQRSVPLRGGVRGVLYYISSKPFNQSYNSHSTRCSPPWRGYGRSLLYFFETFQSIAQFSFNPMFPSLEGLGEVCIYKTFSNSNFIFSATNAALS